MEKSTGKICAPLSGEKWQKFPQKIFYKIFIRFLREAHPLLQAACEITAIAGERYPRRPQAYFYSFNF